jgi:hypothetical protein
VVIFGVKEGTNNAEAVTAGLIVERFVERD